MKKIKRDQRPYELVQQHLSGLILNTILKIVEDLGGPYQAKPGLGGMAAYPPKAMAVVCILMEAEARTYRKMVSHLRMNRSLAMKTGLPKIPSKSTIWRAYGMIPEPYLREVHTRIIGDVMVTGSVAGDSTGYSSNRFVRWFQHPPRPGQAQARLGQSAQHRRHLHQDRPRLPGHRRVRLRHHRIVADAGEDRRGHWFLLPGLGLPGQEDLRRHIRQGHGTAHPAQVQHRLQERWQPGLGRYGQDAQGRAGPVHGRVPPAQHHRGRLWRNQEDVWEPPPEPQARPAEPGDSNPGHLLQHRGGRAIARKKRQAHARVAHCNGCLTGAVTAAPSVGEPAHHPLDRMGFYGFGQTLKPAVCEKRHNPKNSKNTCTDATTADDCGIMSLGHSPICVIT